MIFFVAPLVLDFRADGPELRHVAVRVGVRDSDLFGSWPVRPREGSVDAGQDRGAGTDHDIP